MKKKYNKFFAMSIGISSVSIGLSAMGGPVGVLAGVAVSTGIILADKHLLNNYLSEATLDKIFNKKPKV